MVRDVRIKQYTFSIGSLTADGDGLFNVYSEHPLNGTIQSVVLQANNHTTTGSYLLLSSGLSNSGTNLGEHIITLRAGSSSREYFPFAFGDVNQSVTTSGTSQPMVFQNVIHSTLRLVGSGLGDGTSGLGLTINYI